MPRFAILVSLVLLAAGCPESRAPTGSEAIVTPPDAGLDPVRTPD